MFVNTIKVLHWQDTGTTANKLTNKATCLHVYHSPYLYSTLLQIFLYVENDLIKRAFDTAVKNSLITVRVKHFPSVTLRNFNVNHVLNIFINKH